jgi:hypothetical protein
VQHSQARSKKARPLPITTFIFEIRDISVMRDVILNFIVSVTSAAVTSGILFSLLKEWISTRLKASIQHEYERKLEAYKAQLQTEQELAILNIKTTVAREAAFHAAAHSSFAEGQRASMQRKLNGVDQIWGSVLHLRDNLPPIITFIDVLTVDEHRRIKDNPRFRELTNGLSDEKIIALVPQTAEEVRPYVGEYMWMLFFSYRAILLRILVLLRFGRDDADKIEWYKDTATRGLIEAVLTPEELRHFDAAMFGKVSWLRQRLESKILAAAHKVISGETFGTESLQQANLIQQRIAQLAAQAPR